MQTIVIILTLILASAAPALGQQVTLPTRSGGTLDLGFRSTDISGDEARYQRFRDLGNGGLLDRFRFGREGDRWLLQVSADHAGRQDQRYTAQFNRNGRLKIAFQWDQVPLFISRDTRTLFTSDTPGVLRIADNTQRGLQTGHLSLANVVSQSQLFDEKSRRDIARLNVRFSPRGDVDVKLDLANTLREGTTPFGTMFSTSNVVEVAAPVDTRTTDLTAGVEWTRARGSLRVGYDGSWFDNRVSTLVLDNPLVFSDSTTASGQGRYALSPDSSLGTVSAAGRLKLPARTNASGSVSVGTWSQNEELLPFTINTAFTPVSLERSTAEAKARTLAMNYSVTSRPRPSVWLNARFDYYNFDNRTPVFNLQQYVRYDSSIGTFPQELGGTEPLSFTRKNFDADASLTPLPFSALRVGYSRDWTDRTHRIFERTTEDTVRASLDSTAPGWLTVRALVERSKRSGSGLDEQALTAIGEQAAMRHYDVADRNRNRVTGLVQVSPIQAVGFTASAAAGHDDYTNGGFGLRDSKSRVYTAAFDLAPGEVITAGLSYSYERYTALSNSRSAAPGPQFSDATRNWADDSADKTSTLTMNLGLRNLPRQSEVRLSYDVSRSKATYVYTLPSDSTLTAPQQLPTVLNELRSGTVDYRIGLTNRLALGVTYWYDRYDVEDFQLGPDRVDPLNQPSNLLLGYAYRPYTANSGWVRLIVTW